MVTQEGTPCLAGRPRSLDHVLRDARLSDFKAELKQLAMDTRGTPQWIVNAHLPDQRAQIRVDLRTASKGAGFPTPVSAEAGPMPAHEGLGLDDHDGLQHRWKPPMELGQKHAIPIREVDATAYLAPQYDQLAAEHSIFCFKSGFRLERGGQQRQ